MTLAELNAILEDVAESALLFGMDQEHVDVSVTARSHDSMWMTVSWETDERFHALSVKLPRMKTLQRMEF